MIRMSKMSEHKFSDSEMVREIPLACSDELLLESADRLAAGNPQDASFALTNLQEALRRNVASPDRWCDVGEALLSAGRPGM